MPPPLTSDEEPLCQNVTVGRLGLSFLHLDVSVCHRDVGEWTGVEAQPREQHGETYALTEGVFLELSIQARLTWPLPWRRPHRWLPGRAYVFRPGFCWYLDEPEWSDGMTPRIGVDADDLTRLARISRDYNHNSWMNPASGTNRVRFIPRAVEAEIREIAGRLRRSRGCW